jgi:hypothetical protein
MDSNGYFSIPGVCFYGGDVKEIKGLARYDLAVAAAKQWIDRDPAKCVTLKL